jgi:CubicO group peptidase (beta-lactamase class C family)
MDRVTEVFAENFSARGELGASLSVWQHGREILSLADGWSDRQQTKPWTAETPVLVWSASKGPAATCVLHAMQAKRLNLSTRVAEVWPEFAQHGKSEITLGQALSHQAGVPVLISMVNVHEHEAVVAAIAAQAPHWTPGTAHGYAPRVHGFLLDELVRRISGRTLADYWREHFAQPLGLEFWFGVPPEVEERIAPVFAAKQAPPRDDPFYSAFTTSGSFTARAFASPAGLHSVASLNALEARRASFPGFGGIGTATALAKFYAMLAAGGTIDRREFFKLETLSWMTTTLAQGDDRVLMMETAFSAGFMRDPVDATGRKTRAIFGSSPRAFGHPGAGGSHAFADPEGGWSFAYVMNQMEPGVLPGRKALALIEAIEQELSA